MRLYKPKYGVEFLLEFQSADRFLYRASDLYSLEADADPERWRRLEACHIYLIGKRPRLSIVPDSVCADATVIRLRVEYKNHGKSDFADVSLSRSIFTAEEATFRASPYPHRELVSFDSRGTRVGTTLLATAAHLLHGLNDKARDLQVVYVGKGVSTSAQDRLQNHSTVQRICTELSSNEPDSELFILVHSFQYKKLCLAFLGLDPEISGQLAKARARRAVNYRPLLSEQVDLIEAVLIPYFGTAYNKQYVKFPSRRHTILSGVYAGDFAAIRVDLNNESLGGLRVSSEKVLPAARHWATVDFRLLEGRPSVLAERPSIV